MLKVSVDLANQSDLQFAALALRKKDQTYFGLTCVVDMRKTYHGIGGGVL